MIFLAVGNWHKGFDRLIKAVDELVGSAVITDDVTAQTGYSSYKPKHMIIKDFCSPDEFINIISQARLVISHAGVGTIAQAVNQSKPVIVIPRKVELGEHFDDHQFATARQFEAEGKILVAYEVSDLPAKLEEARTFVPAKSESCEKILDAVKEFIDSIAAKRRA